MATFKYVQNDTAPDMVINITRQGVGAVDLTGASVDFRILDPDSNSITNTGHTPCTIVSATGGQVKYVFQTGDLPAAKTYQADVVITWASGKEETAYAAVPINVRAEA